LLLNDTRFIFTATNCWSEKKIFPVAKQILAVRIETNHSGKKCHGGFFLATSITTYFWEFQLSTAVDNVVVTIFVLAENLTQWSSIWLMG
jgi:hypothetical protein